MSDFNNLIEGEKPTLVDFFATWCGPCKMQGPILEQVKLAVGDSAHILKVDVDNNRELAEQYMVQSVPTLILFKGGKPIERMVGLQQAATLEEKIKALL
jgi:thioredoxin 1